MKLQQLRFFAAVAQNDLNLTAAAAKLYTTQPAISKQLRLLESELGFNIFVRSGRTFVKITKGGERVLTHALRMLREAQNIRNVSAEIKDESRGILSIGTTHTQARYVLPPVLQQFREKYPQVQFHLHQGTAEQLAEMARMDRIDFAIVTGSRDSFPQYRLLPYYQWHRRIVVPADHPLARSRKLSLKRLASFPIVTYVFNFTGPSSLQEIFAQAGLRLQVALTARDSDVIKTYVRIGLGVGIMAGVAVDPNKDRDLVSLSAAHLFPAQTTWVGFSRNAMLRGYMYEFLSLMSPHLSRPVIDQAIACASQEEIDALFSSMALPVK
jgi:LysR family cys regulon transcriptional activator